MEKKVSGCGHEVKVAGKSRRNGWKERKEKQRERKRRERKGTGGTVG